MGPEGCQFKSDHSDEMFKKKQTDTVKSTYNYHIENKTVLVDGKEMLFPVKVFDTIPSPQTISVVESTTDFIDIDDLEHPSN